jgi:hypothetical protein
MYHGAGIADWTTKLNQSLANAAASGKCDPRETLQVGLALVPQQGNVWEPTAASVQDRFAAMAAAGIEKVHVFSWPPWPWSTEPLLPVDTLAEWTKQLENFAAE